MVQLIPLDPSL